MHFQRKVVLYIAMSLDGYIAGPGDDLSFLDSMAAENEDYGYGAFTAGTDTVIMGRKTYDWVMSQVPEFPHAGKETFIITRSPKPPKGTLSFYTGQLDTLVASLKQKSGKNIFVDGGASVVNALLQQNLVDEMIISVIPTLLGGGTALFAQGIPCRPLRLLSSQRFASGLVQLHYSF